MRVLRETSKALSGRGVVLKRTVGFSLCSPRGWWGGSSAAEAVQRAALALEGVDHVHGGDGLPLGVLAVGDGVPDDVLQEDLQDPPRLLVDQPRDALDAAAAGQAADGGLGDALDVVPEDLPVALGPALPETLPSLPAARHDGFRGDADGGYTAAGEANAEVERARPPALYTGALGKPRWRRLSLRSHWLGESPPTAAERAEEGPMAAHHSPRPSSRSKYT